MGNKVGNPPIPLGKIKISDSFGRGWTETYNLKGNTYATAHANFAPILNFRQLILGQALTVADWSISDSNVSHDGYKSEDGVDIAIKNLVGDAAGPPIIRLPCNQLEDAIKVRFATGNPAPPPGTMTGKGITYLFRGVRDTWITNQNVMASLVGSIDRSFTPTALGVGLTAVHAWQTFLYWVMVGTLKVTNVAGVPDNTNLVYDLVRAFTKPLSAHRDTGRDPTASKGRIRRQFV